MNICISYFLFRYEVKLMQNDDHTILSRIRYPDQSVERLQINEESEVINDYSCRIKIQIIYSLVNSDMDATINSELF